MTLADFDLVRDPLAAGVTLLEASAGTGKTFTITHLVVRELLADPTLEPRQVLLTTFTNAAADELADRLRVVMTEARAACAADVHNGALGPAADLVRAAIAHTGDRSLVAARLEVLGQQADLIRVSTIHSTANRILDEFGFETATLAGGEPLINDGVLVEQALRDCWRRTILPDPLFAAVAATWKDALKTDRAVVSLARRAPSPVIEPPAPRVADARQALAEALAAVRDPSALRSLLAQWTAAATKKTFCQVLSEVSAFVALAETAEVLVVLHIAEMCTPDAIFAAINRTTTKGKILALTLPKHPFCLLCATVLRCVALLRQAWWALLAAEVPPAVVTAARAAGLRLSDDSLAMVDAALADAQRGPPLIARLRQRFRLVFIDEFQDTDPVQWSIFQRIYAGAAARASGVRLVLIGDPKQAIYAFRGGDLPTYLQAAATADQRWRLGTNWRTSAELLAAIDQLFAGERPFVAEGLSYQPAHAAPSAPPALTEPGDSEGSGPLRWMMPDQPITSKSDASFQLARWIAAEISRLLQVRTMLGTTPLHPGHCAVLVHSHRQAALLRRALQRVGLPSVLGDAGDMLDGAMAPELQRLLLAVLSPDKRTIVHTALASRLIGFTDIHLTQLTASDEEAITLHLLAARRTWQQHGVATAIEELITAPWPGGPDEPPAVRLAGEPDGERLLTDLRHAADWLAARERDEHLVPAAVLRQLTPGPSASVTPDELRQRLETDARAVRIVTMHAAKGLEWPVVFCPFLWVARAVDLDQPLRLRHAGGARLLLDPASDPSAGVLAEGEALAERLRLAYVAVTRAKVRCYVAWGAFGKGAVEPQRSALGWLLGNRSPAGTGGFSTSGSLFADSRLRCATTAGWILMPPPVEHGAHNSVDEADPATFTAPRATPMLTRPAAAGQLRSWGLSSFTRLTRLYGVHERELPAAADDPSPRDEPGTALSTVDLITSNLARGSGAGTALHALLELHDWSAPPDSAMIARLLARHGLADAHAHYDLDPVPIIGQLITSLAQCRLPGAQGFRLADTVPAQRRVEWRFLVPVERIDNQRLAECLVQSSSPAVRAYATEGLLQLNAYHLRGYLTGSADLVVTHGDRWHVLDWKSNHLGLTAQDYAAERLWSVMADEHYILQYHLYALALDRFLATRIPSYDRALHLGSVWYVFLRGVGQVPGDGIVHDQPSVEVLSALDRLLRPPRFRITA